LTLRDVRTGERHQLSERNGATGLRVGDLICARVVPDGEGMRILGGIEPVGLAQRDELIKLLDANPDPVELVAFLTRRFAPPNLGDTTGPPTIPAVAAGSSGRSNRSAVTPGLMDPDRPRAELGLLGSGG
jgi:hypothetical protein